MGILSFSLGVPTCSTRRLLLSSMSTPSKRPNSRYIWGTENFGAPAPIIGLHLACNGRNGKIAAAAGRLAS
jgi:hypothetical protein